MPEEKVSQPFGETVADIRNSYVQADPNAGFMLSPRPAADAGPRQPDTCKNCYKPIWFDSIPGRGWRHEDHRYECFSPTKAEPLAPPVPQEAAPYDDPGNLWQRVGPAATAPDSAMRVAREVLRGSKLFTIDGLAALIREAGSERERRLEKQLRQILKCYREYRRSCDDDWDTDSITEANRLLGEQS